MSQQTNTPALYESLWPPALRARLAGETDDAAALAGEIATLRALLYEVAADATLNGVARLAAFSRGAAVLGHLYRLHSQLVSGAAGGTRLLDAVLAELDRAADAGG